MPECSGPDTPANYRTIAQASGVGKTTVGRVLQGTGYVSKDVRERVMNAAKQLGYRPDPALGALSRRRWPKGASPQTATLAWIFRARRKTAFPNAPEFHGVIARAKELGYSVDAFNLGDYPSESALSRVIYSRGIRGVLVQAMRDSEGLDLDWPRFHTVYVGPENDLSQVHNVQADFRLAMHRGVATCVERGYRKIGIALMNYLASGTNVPFRAQALHEIESLEKSIGPQPPLFEFQPNDLDPRGLLRWEKTHRVDVVVATHILPYYFLTAAQEFVSRLKSRKVPEDVAFICLRNATEFPFLTHLDLREYEQGRQAVNLVHQQLQHGVIGKPDIPLRLLVPSLFVEGSTLPVRRQAEVPKRKGHSTTC